MYRVLVLAVVAVFAQASGNAETLAGEIDFVRDVRPILQRHCYACHGETRQKSGLRLDVRSAAFEGGDQWGPSLVARNASQSPLIELVTSPDPDVRMPPEGAPLSAAEMETLTRWIDEGAVWPAGVDLADEEDKRDHWSFKPFIRGSKYPGLRAEEEVDSSSVDGAKPASERLSPLGIDDFIDAKLAEKGLVRNPSADPRTIVRRMVFDLTGLPPNPEEVDAFVAEPDVARLVDKLLASPRYGERWAQHWLDVIRWAETVGFETNAERRHAWPYRDWVIAALNEDKPYDRFVFEQIAGDTVGADAALGFLVAGPANLAGQVGRDEAAMRGARQDELDEVISTVSQAFLGLTVGCARCHDHKFDPILQSDYYSMQAIFASLNYGSRRLRGAENEAWTAQVPAARVRVESLRAELEGLRRQHGLREPLADVHTETFEPVLASAVRMRINATTNGAAASLYEFEVWSKATGEEDQAINVALASAGRNAFVPRVSSWLTSRAISTTWSTAPSISGKPTPGWPPTTAQRGFRSTSANQRPSSGLLCTAARACPPTLLSRF